MSTFVLTMLFVTLVSGHSATAPTLLAVNYADQSTCEAARIAFYQNVPDDENYARIAWCTPYASSSSQRPAVLQ